jgi:DNA primase
MATKTRTFESELSKHVTIFREHEKEGEYQCSCPFHENHKDGGGRKSFWINPDKNVYTCWSCKESGTALSLLTIQFEIDYYDAIELINYNPLEDLEVVPYEDRLKRSDSTGVVKRIDVDHPISIRPPKWILDRFNNDIVKRLKVGHMFNKGNLITTFPVIWDDVIVGLAYRVDTPKGKMMWFNEGFDKENYFYNQPQNLSYVCLVEGQTDTLTVLSHGTKNTSGVMGSFLTHPQLKQLKKLDCLEEVWLAFDNDNAGIVCTLITGTIIEMYLPDIEVLVLPIISDPGDSTKEDWKDFVERRTPFAEYKVIMSMLIGEDFRALQAKAKKHIDKWIYIQENDN